MTLIKKAPKAPAYFNALTKKHFEDLAAILIKAEILKEKHLPTLEILAQNRAQHEFALSEIDRKNNEMYGSGYVQTFKTGATNVTAEVTLKEKAEKAMLQCLKLFGLDPKSEKDLDIQEKKEEVDIFKAMGLTK